MLFLYTEFSFLKDDCNSVFCISFTRNTFNCLSFKFSISLGYNTGSIPLLAAAAIKALLIKSNCSCATVSDPDNLWTSASLASRLLAVPDFAKFADSISKASSLASVLISFSILPLSFI